MMPIRISSTVITVSCLIACVPLVIRVERPGTARVPGYCHAVPRELLLGAHELSSMSALVCRDALGRESSSRFEHEGAGEIKQMECERALVSVAIRT